MPFSCVYLMSQSQLNVNVLSIFSFVETFTSVKEQNMFFNAFVLILLASTVIAITNPCPIGYTEALICGCYARTEEKIKQAY